MIEEIVKVLDYTYETIVDKKGQYGLGFRRAVDLFHVGLKKEANYNLHILTKQQKLEIEELSSTNKMLKVKIEKLNAQLQKFQIDKELNTKLKIRADLANQVKGFINKGAYDELDVVLTKWRNYGR